MTQDHCTTPLNKGSTQEPTLGLRVSLALLPTLKTASVWFLWLPGDREEDWVCYVELEGLGAEQNNAVLGQDELDDHAAPQPAPALHVQSSGASATFTKPATHLVNSSRSQAAITREVPTNCTVPWRPLDAVIQTVVL